MTAGSTMAIPLGLVKEDKRSPQLMLQKVYGD